MDSPQLFGPALRDHGPPGAGPRTVLVVEDSKFQRTVLTSQLRQWEYEVLEAADGHEALRLFERHAPRLIITDLQMPIVDGFELVRSVRKTEIGYTYIIVISGMSGQDSIVSAIAAGADDYIHKPFHPKELEARLGTADRVLRSQSQELLIFALAQLADYRSRETGHHLSRVQHYSRILAEELGRRHYPHLNRARVSLIASMSCLHDIGKVAIPDSILNKPDKLSRLEFTIIKEHTRIGGRILDDVYRRTGAEQLRVARDVIMHHHERYDGNGYPEGLEGPDIPLSARIVALADVFDALATKRCYKAAYPLERCRDIIVSERCRQFDPMIVDAYLAREDEFREILAHYRDEE